MTLLMNGQTVNGHFNGATRGVLINSYTFQANQGDPVFLRATARGYHPAQLTLRVTGPIPATSVVSMGLRNLHIVIPQTGVYQVELIY